MKRYPEIVRTKQLTIAARAIELHEFIHIAELGIYFCTQNLMQFTRASLIRLILNFAKGVETRDLDHSINSNDFCRV